jgi:hypothetical protein
MNRGHILIAAAVLAVLAIVGGVAVATSGGESCADWSARYTASLRAVVDSDGDGRDAAIRHNLAVHDERPEGCR